MASATKRKLYTYIGDCFEICFDPLVMGRSIKTRVLSWNGRDDLIIRWGLDRGGDGVCSMEFMVQIILCGECERSRERGQVSYLSNITIDCHQNVTRCVSHRERLKDGTRAASSLEETRGSDKEKVVGRYPTSAALALRCDGTRGQHRYRCQDVVS